MACAISHLQCDSVAGRPHSIRRHAPYIGAIAAALFLLPAASAGASSYTVATTSFGTGDSVADDDCVDDTVASCTLRAAIDEANSHAGPDSIDFEGSFDGTAVPSTITIPDGTPLPPLTSATDIVGGNCGSVSAPRPCVELTSDGTPAGLDGLVLGSGWSGTISGLAFTAFDVGVQMDATGTLSGNWWGLGLNGTALGDGATNQANVSGAVITADAASVGGTTAATRNDFAHNNTVGLELLGSDSSSVTGNYFGTRGDGSAIAGLANGDAIQVRENGADTAQNNVIGGTDLAATPACDGACNVIANTAGDGNPSGDGIDLADAADPAHAAQGTTVKGNYIGLQANGSDGSLDTFTGGPSGVRAGNNEDVTIGGPLTGDRNYIGGTRVGVSGQGTGNDPSGLEIRNNWFGLAPNGTIAVPLDVYGTIFGPYTKVIDNVLAGGNGTTRTGIYDNGGHATIQGNQVGVDSAGTLSRFGEAGIYIGNSAFSTVGGTGAGQGNVIAGTQDSVGTNSGPPGALKLSVSSGIVTILGNHIGTDASGTANLGGNSDGIFIGEGSTGSAKNLIGDDTAAGENVISNQAGSAIAVNANRSVEIKGNTGSGNGAIFIDLQSPKGPGNDAYNPGDPATSGANTGIQPPLIQAVDPTSASGTSDPNAVVRIHRKETASPGELGAQVATTTADGSGNWTVIFGSQADGRFVATQSRVSDFFNATNYFETSELSGVKVLDTIAPETTITQHPPATVKKKRGKAKLVFNWDSNESPVTSECSFVEVGQPQDFAACDSPFTRKVKVKRRPQNFEFAVRTTDESSNVDTSPDTAEVKVVKKR